jgi:hypothetical protein
VKILYLYVLQQSQEGCQELWRDIRAVRWTRCFVWFTFLSWLAGLVTAIIFSITMPRNLNVDGFCQPDGTFNSNQAAYQIFKPSGFFQITLGNGELPFATAKLIDIIWDIVSPCSLPTPPSFHIELTVVRTDCWPWWSDNFSVYLMPSTRQIFDSANECEQPSHLQDVPDCICKKQPHWILDIWIYARIHMASSVAIQNGYDLDYTFYSIRC